jgi:DNA-binding transcriptional regulator YdaS (Cro superfamily)
MNLEQYFNRYVPSERRQKKKELAGKLRVSYSYIVSMCNRHRRIPEKYAIAIEEATNGAVRREDVWPELRK